MNDKTRVENIDCMIRMRETPDKFYDLAIVDPPYGINVSKMAYTQKPDRTVTQKNGNNLTIRKLNYKHGNWDSSPPDDNYFTELFRVSKNQIIWGENYLDQKLKGGRIVWNKLTPDGTSFSNCEIAFCSLHERVRYVEYMWAGMMQGEGFENPKIQKGDKTRNEVRIHPTQKPVALYKWLLKNYAKEGYKIVDTHLGSQSSRIAAFDLGFDFTGYELDKDYFEAGNKRFNQHKSQLKLFPVK